MRKRRERILFLSILSLHLCLLEQWQGSRTEMRQRRRQTNAAAQPGRRAAAAVLAQQTEQQPGVPNVLCLPWIVPMYFLYLVDGLPS